MRLVFVCFYQAFPPDCGADSVTWNVAKHAPGERILIQFGPSYSETDTRDGVTIITLAGAINSRWKKIGGLRSRIRRIAHIIEHVKPQAVVLEGASWILYHLFLLRKIRRRQPRTTIVYHSHNVEYVLRRTKHGRIVTAITKWAEGRILREADLSFAVSEVDRQQFESLYGVRPHLLPNGVDLESFYHVTKGEAQLMRERYHMSNRTILFMGAYVYKPNQEAIDFLVNSVMPKVVQKQPDATLLIMGGRVPYNEPWLINPAPIPHDQLPAFVKACGVGVAPIFSGSGTRLKILEYMAGGIPVVATSKGAEGLKVKDGDDIILAEKAEDFASRIVEMMNNQQYSSRISRQAKKTIEQNYSWNMILRGFEETLQGLRQRGFIQNSEVVATFC